MKNKNLNEKEMEMMGILRYFRDRYFIGVLLLPLVLTQLAFGQTPRLEVKNITRTSSIIEVNPGFIAAGSHVLYMEFTGTSESACPWDYRLMLADRDGANATPLTFSGVVDYAVLEGGPEVLILFADRFESETGLSVNFYNHIRHWELRRLNVKTLESMTVQKSDSQPLVEGYRALGVTGLPDWELEQFVSESPGGKNNVEVSRKITQSGALISYRLVTHDDANTIFFETDAYLTQTHFNWLPSIVWLDDNRFLTQAFQSDPHLENTQAQGLFSIVMIDLSNQQHQLLHKDRRLKPFPAFALDETRHLLYFQQQSGEITELWRLNLSSGVAQVIFETPLELGKVRSSLDGSSLLVGSFEKDNCDIIRLDVKQNDMRRLAGN